MFSGIIEAQVRVRTVTAVPNLLRIEVERPSNFHDLKPGDSIATDGVCLTVETFTNETMTFALGAETLQITGWTAASLADRSVNVERSLRLGDRIHGHLVSGHVDAIGLVREARFEGECLLLAIETPKTLAPYLWPKGSWAVNGVSLTINSIVSGLAHVCLVPETLKRTNLAAVSAGSSVNLEVDQMARGCVRYWETKGNKSDEYDS